MKYKLQKLGLGGILDQAIAIVKDNFGLLFGILLCAWIPFQLIQQGVALAMMPELPANPTMEDFIRLQQAAMANLPITISLALIGGFIIFPVTNAAVIQAVAERYLGRTITPMEAIQAGFSRLGPLLLTTILMVLAVMGGFLLLIIPGILFLLWFGLVQHVVVLEGISGTKALGRSRDLVRPNMGTFLVLGIIITVIVYMVAAGAAFVPNKWLQMVVAVLVQSVLTLFSTAAVVVFYFSCRCGVDNFDLEHLAEAVGGTSDSASEEKTDDAW